MVVKPYDQCKQVQWTSKIATFIGKIIICKFSRLFGLQVVLLLVFNFVIRLEGVFNV